MRTLGSAAFALMLVFTAGACERLDDETPDAVDPVDPPDPVDPVDPDRKVGPILEITPSTALLPVTAAALRVTIRQSCSSLKKPPR